MNRRFFQLCLVVGVATVLSTHASAAFTLTVPGAEYVGRIVPDSPANPANETSYINYLTTLAPGAAATVNGSETFDRLQSTLAGPFAAAVDTGDFRQNSSNPVAVLATTFQYVLARYGNNGALVWYSPTGFSGSVTVPANLGGAGTGGGLSHISAYNPGVIPEPSSLLVWGGLVGLAGLSRRRRG